LDKKEKAAKLEEEAKKLVPAKFHKWIHVFGKKASEWILRRKLCNHAIDKGGIYAEEGKGISVVEGRVEEDT